MKKLFLIIFSSLFLAACGGDEFSEVDYNVWLDGDEWVLEVTNSSDEDFKSKTSTIVTMDEFGISETVDVIDGVEVPAGETVKLRGPSSNITKPYDYVTIRE